MGVVSTGDVSKESGTETAAGWKDAGMAGVWPTGSVSWHLQTVKLANK